jgi:hypothetical protein
VGFDTFPRWHGYSSHDRHILESLIDEPSWLPNQRLGLTGLSRWLAKLAETAVERFSKRLEPYHPAAHPQADGHSEGLKK